MIETAPIILVKDSWQNSLKKSGKIKHVITYPEINLSFLITENKILVKTPLQIFILEPIKAPGGIGLHLVNLRDMIIKRRVNNYDSLFKECNGVIELVPTKLERYV